MITRRSVNALVLGGTDPRVADEEPGNSRVISYDEPVQDPVPILVTGPQPARGLSRKRCN